MTTCAGLVLRPEEGDKKGPGFSCLCRRQRETTAAGGGAILCQLRASAELGGKGGSSY